MKINCEYGSTIFDATDDIPYKAYLIPDQKSGAKWDTLDNLIDSVAKGQVSAEAAAMKARQIFLTCSRGMWQCGACGKLYLDGPDGRLQCFTPSTPETDRESLRCP